MKTKLTRAAAEEIIGMCEKCKEYVSLATPCCNSSVRIDGSLYSPDDFEIVEGATEEVRSA